MEKQKPGHHTVRPSEARRSWRPGGSPVPGQRGSWNAGRNLALAGLALKRWRALPEGVMSRLCRIAALLVSLTLACAGCGGAGRSVAGPPEFGDPAQLVSFLTVTPAAFQAGESVQVVVGVRNPTPYAIRYGHACFSFKVVDANGVYVAPGHSVDCASKDYVIAPGGTLAMSGTWDGTGWGVPLPPGEYRVTGAGVVPSPTPVDRKSVV